MRWDLMIIATIGFSTVLWAIVFVVVSAVITLAIYYIATGDWLWDRGNNDDRRNWPPPR